MGKHLVLELIKAESNRKLPYICDTNPGHLVAIFVWCNPSKNAENMAMQVFAETFTIYIFSKYFVYNFLDFLSDYILRVGG